MRMYRSGSFGDAGRGGGLRFGPGLSMPPVVRSLLIANVAIFILMRLPGINAIEMQKMFGLVPTAVFLEGRVWQLFTYMFLHGNLIHLAVNMFLLWMFGSAVAAAWGGRDFFIYYTICGLGGGLTSWITGPGSEAITIGASGAVLGVLLAYTLMNPDQLVLLYFLIPIKMKYLMWLFVIVDLLAAFGSNRDGVAHFAHLGGMLSGYLFLKQDWRLGALQRKVKGARARRRMADQIRRHTEEQLTREEERAQVDRILDKISEQGIESLTEQERRILREASRH